MYLKLKDKSFIKKRPDTYLFSPYKDGIRDSVEINKTALDILDFCDGTNTIDYIVGKLKNKYNEKEEVVKENVEEFLLPLIDSGLIDNSNQPENNNFKSKMMRGSRKIFYPDIIIWEVTDFCPLNCKHCYLGNKSGSIFSKNDIDKVLEIIDKSGVYQVQLTGGEALSHPNIDYIIENLVQRGIIICVSTSGFILNDKILNSLLKLKSVYKSFVKVSLDGNESTHNYIRQNEDSYKRALNFIKTLSEHGVECQIGTTIVNQTKDELENLTDIVKKNGASLIEFGLLSNQGNAKANNLTSFLNSEELFEFLQELNSKFTDDKFIVKVPIEKITAMKNCGAGYKLVVVKANKDISICPISEFSVGNIDNCSIEDIMLKCGDKFSKLDAPNEKLCGDCKNRIECGGCTSRALILKNTVEKCKWFESQSEIFTAFFNA